MLSLEDDSSSSGSSKALKEKKERKERKERTRSGADQLQIIRNSESPSRRHSLQQRLFNPQCIIQRLHAFSSSGSSKALKEKKERKERKERTRSGAEKVKVEVPTDILHPELYRALSEWRTAKTREVNLPA